METSGNPISPNTEGKAEWSKVVALCCKMNASHGVKKSMAAIAWVHERQGDTDPSEDKVADCVPQ